jgi:outer membrane protein assembly factor BamB
MTRHQGLRFAWLSGGILFTALTLSAGDWPMYRHDAARSGATSEALKLPLDADWVFRPLHRPEQAWGEPNPRAVGGLTGMVEGRRLQYDDTFHAAVAGGSVYFGSSADGKVYALDAATGRIRWTAFTGGPVRMAPTVWQDKVYVGSDDGFAYCLRAADGAEVWRVRAAIRDRLLLGSGKMISPWPLRTGILVDGQPGAAVAYFGAGVFPSDGVYLFAVDAENGKPLWCYDAGGDSPFSTFSPQGYLLASATRLYVPQGRVSPAVFDRKDGRALSDPELPFSFQHAIGGTHAMLDGDRLFTGTEEIVGYDPTTGERFGWFTARQMVLTPDLIVMADGKDLKALNRQTYPDAGLRRRTLYEARQGLLDRWSKANTAIEQAAKALSRSERALQAIDKEIAALGGQPVPPALQSRRDAAAGKADADRQALETARRKTVIKEKEEADKALAEADAALPAALKWRVPTPCAEALILAGDIVIAGGTSEVVAVEAETGKTLWSTNVDGAARGLAVADGRLFVSTGEGTIYCFAPRGTRTHGTVQPAVNPTPYPRDAFGQLCEAAADRIVRSTGIRKGYALVLGSGTGRLACELARRTDLTIYGIESDPAQVAAARRALDAAGLYGKRVRIDQGDPAHAPYADFFANLIVSETALAGQVPGSARETFRMLKPLGGALAIGQPAAPGQAAPLTAAALRAWCADSELKAAPITEQDGVWLAFARGALPGAGTWTHHYANPGNTTCSDDQRVKCPLGLLWYGEPGPGKMADRHMRPVSPLAANGRMFIQGEGTGKTSDGQNVILCYDAYNGVELWERTIPGGLRLVGSHDGGNVALNDDSLFLAAGANCHRLDAATGATKHTYDLPPAAGNPVPPLGLRGDGRRPALRLARHPRPGLRRNLRPGHRVGGRDVAVPSARHSAQRHGDRRRDGLPRPHERHAGATPERPAGTDRPGS